ncbi:MAG: DEAD/DEAH box helicase [Candidatus Omnitrophota bacterium]|nr:MAG: DEAD/DEAH box helicase [Candidatus Omnitrophota bacterium]
MNTFKLDAFQEEAIEYARKNHSVIVSAPTGAGKTLIAEYVIQDCMRNNKGVIYTAPIKALSNQKFRDFSRKYPECVGILTGDVSINREAPILIMTTEIFRNAILVEPKEFENREWVIFDEIHYLDDIERGTVWEEAIILLPSHMKMLALSATISNIDEFVEWLNKIHTFPIKAIVETQRPVPLHFFFQCNNQFFTHFKKLKKSGVLRKNLRKHRDFAAKNVYTPFKPNRLYTLIEYLENKNALPCLCFSFSRRRCEELAREASYFAFLGPQEKKQIVELFDQLVRKFDIASSPHTSFLFPLIKKGIAYHHAGLLPSLKEIIEQLFTTGLIKLIFTTETFALGINMPARTVVFDALSKFYGRYHGYLKTRDFYQMAGRAGRRGIDKEGYVFSKIAPQAIDLLSLEDIIYGEYEPIRSQLNSCYATILNLYKIMGEKIYDIYPRTFSFHQAKIWQKKETLDLLKRKLTLLEDLHYITGHALSWKADLASKVYSFELPIGELFENGYLENLDEENLFITIAALVYEPRKGEKKPRLSKRVKRLKRDLNPFMRDIHREERKQRIYPLSKKFYFHLSEASRMWFEGIHFSRLNKVSYVDEGEIVRYFRMGIQVMREIYSSQTISKDLKNKIINCIKRINRDVVDAEKQLRQEI